MWIVAGLGNPGDAYAHTRHNAGFMVVEELARRWRLVWEPPHAGLRVARGTIDGAAVLLVQPQEFMNRSGETVAKLARDPEDPLLVVYDDLDLPLGAVRVRPRGGSGGHRGLASMIEQLGSELVRVRVGIGRPPEGVDPVEFVLEPLSAEAEAQLRPAIERAADAIECVVTAGVETAMNRFNVRSTPANGAA